jgi:hypothetical protein
MIWRYVRSSRPDALRTPSSYQVRVGDIHSGTATEATALARYHTTRDTLADRLFRTVETHPSPGRPAPAAPAAARGQLGNE